MEIGSSTISKKSKGTYTSGKRKDLKMSGTTAMKDRQNFVQK